MLYIKQYLESGGSERSLSYFYNRYGGGMYMAVSWNVDSLVKFMNAGEDQDYDIALHEFSEIEALPIVIGQNFTDCINKLDDILRKAGKDNHREMDSLFGEFYYCLFERGSGISSDELLSKVKAMKAKW